MLQHLRPVKVVLTPLHLRVLFCDRFLHLVLLLLLRENLHPSIRFRNRGGRLADKVVHRFGSSAARLFPVGSADWRSLCPAKGDDHGCPNPPGFLPPCDQVNGGSGISHSPLGALSAGRKITLEKNISIRGNAALDGARFGFESKFIFWVPIPLLQLLHFQRDTKR